MLLGEGGNFIWDDNGYRVFTASGFETYTVDDIIAEHGPRVPDTSKAQKDFRAAVVLLVGYGLFGDPRDTGPLELRRILAKPPR